MWVSREDIEAREERHLAHYAMRAGHSRGRQHPEDEALYRTAFQRDRDRVLHTTAFRRLEYKTQVFINYEGDYYRTRLTHTLEVAQIGRTIARALAANEDLTEAICLAHDLGHPPFGHAGEAALASLMRDHGGFDHNRQSLRIVTELERRYPDFPGLNLTWEVREGLVKHENAYDLLGPADAGTPRRGHLEAQIADAADELAYTAHDLDDGLRAGLISPGDLAGLRLWETLRASIGWTEDSIEELARHQLVRRLIKIAVRDMLESTGRRLQAADPRSPADLQALPDRVVGFSDDFGAARTELGRCLHERFYRHHRMVRMAVKAERFLSDLFQAYVQQPQMLPVDLVARTQEQGLERTVCDYIAGMTDRYALDEHRRLFDPYTRP